MILAMTGHRKVDASKFNVRLQAVFDEVKPEAFIQGMATGADLLSAVFAIKAGIPVISAMPWQTHYNSIDQSWRETYRWVLAKSDEVYVVTEEESFVGNWLYFRRNEWMVDECDRVVAWWDGRASGGTFGCIQYANKVGKPVRNIYA